MLIIRRLNCIDAASGIVLLISCRPVHRLRQNCVHVEDYNKRSGFGGLEVACWPLVPKFAGSNPAEDIGFLRVNKNPQHVGGHGCLSVVIVVCCQVEVSATN